MQKNATEEVTDNKPVTEKLFPYAPKYNRLFHSLPYNSGNIDCSPVTAC
jgi:hypothetical protein